MREKKIKVPIFPINFIIVEFESDDEMQKRFPDGLFIPDIEYFDGGVFEYKEKVYVCFRKYKKANKDYPTNSVIVHETVHLVNEIFKWIHHELSVDNDEVQAYLTEWVFNQISSFINE